MRRYDEGAGRDRCGRRATLEPRAGAAARISCTRCDATAAERRSASSRSRSQVGVLSRRRFVRRLPPLRRERAATAPSRCRRPGPGSRRAARSGSRRRAGASLEGGAAPELAGRLCAVVEHGDDLTVAPPAPVRAGRRVGIRPAADARALPAGDACRPARAALGASLPVSAAAQRRVSVSLDAAGRQLHCETCLIDFSADFDRSVEVTFAPAAAMRHVERLEFCVGGPQLTPHVVAQQLVRRASGRSLESTLEPRQLPAPCPRGDDRACRRVAADGAATPGRARLTADGWDGRRADARRAGAPLDARERDREPSSCSCSSGPRGATRRQRRPRSPRCRSSATCSPPRRCGRESRSAVGSVTVVFTDLRGSTRYYRDVGDAPAFGSVLEHLDVLRQEVAAEGGAVVKSLGDAIMAVFPRPVARRAGDAERRSRRVAGKPLELKVGIHAGPLHRREPERRARLLRLHGQPCRPARRRSRQAATWSSPTRCSTIRRLPLSGSGWSRSRER